MKLIKNPAGLEINRIYWLRSRNSKFVYKALYDKVRGVGVFSFEPFQITMRNLSEDQLFELYDVVGPIPVQHEPDWELLLMMDQKGLETNIGNDFGVVTIHMPLEVMMPSGRTITKLEMKKPTDQEIKDGLS